MLHAFRKAFPRTMPVLAGYLFIGIAYGISMKQNGFGAGWTAFSSLTVYAGAMQFALIEPLQNAFAPLTIALLSLLIQARHIFYGLSMLDQYSTIGKGRFYLIFSLTDETYSLLCNGAPQGEDPEKWYLAVSMLDHLYWLSGSILGAVLGELLPLQALNGIDFAMTALFTVILTDQLTAALSDAKKGVTSHFEALFSPLLGGVSTLLCLILLGRERFLLLAMILILGGFVLRWFLLEKEREKA